MRAFSAPLPLAALLLIASCATPPVVLNEIPRPAPSLRLRVFVQPLESKSDWRIPYSQYAKSTFEKVSKVWFDTGIYEVAPAADVDAVAGTARRSMRWKTEDYALAKRVASALWAEYAMLVERIESNRQYSYATTLINVRTGAVFRVSMRVPGGTRDDYQPIIRASYKQLFKDARGDMLLTARFKRDTAGGSTAAGQAAAAPPEISRNLDFARINSQAEGAGSRIPVAVYDMDAKEEDRLLARILSEALRLELVSHFELVSREALAQLEQCGA